MEIGDIANSGSGEQMEGLVIATTEELTTIPKYRPPCPACLSVNIMSRGPEWECLDCGRRIKKIRTTDRRRTCPHCGMEI